MSKPKYHVKLWYENFVGEFEVEEKETTIDAFANRKVLILNKPTGEQFAYDMSKFMGIEITKNVEARK